ncbi:SOS response-associated peptidase [Arthrobacter sp. zg-Y916]|uniref:Abasic site processing protein n=1 Tax=Arthrobacter caoxuetaonis TaxID=2886935 RepID=A0A9X1MEB4_9MICC|nr:MULTISPECIES: SOS response-associated peptidase [Arthrobacter]MCC3297782.1 SOS response-associated peptidase [Arthrobacter caoxuetaonis]MCC9193676.1 SOS response-associated peptidase [Arthrobacter sp. zg-Y916]USQ56024.1 SOS response-associated peptidase [Arthrobacter caoxuetaonis]
MCGRYVMARAIGDLVAEAEAEADANLELRQSWNVAPTSDVPVVLERLVHGARVRQIHTARWGLVPAWAKDISVGVRGFNARSETLLEKPTFREAVLSRRCAVPMDGYYEWKKGPGGIKQPYIVRRTDGKLSWFAGLYEWWADPAVPAGQDGRWLLSTSIITLAAPDPRDADPVLASLGSLHDRLPLPLSAAALADWIRPGTLGQAAAIDLLAGALDQAYATAGQFRLDPADHAVGNVSNDGPWLLEAATARPASAPEDALF